MEPTLLRRIRRMQFRPDPEPSQVPGRHSLPDPPFKVCCAICGVLLTGDDARTQIVTLDGVAENINDIHPFFESPEGGKLELTGWLNCVRLLGDVRPAWHHMEVWLTQVINDCGNGNFGVVGVPGIILTYSRDKDESYVVPFHDECYQILQQYLGPDDINLAVLYDTFVGLSKDDDTSTSLGITSRYEADELICTYSSPFRKGVEYLSISPMDIPELERFYTALPLRQPDFRTDEAPIHSRAPSSDPFRRLAPEVLFMIASQMDIRTFFRWRAASLVLASCPLPNSFWKGRVRQDMGWLFDFPQLANPAAEPQVDWEQAFKSLDYLSKPSTEGRIDGLTNRRYIWEQQCPQIARPYAFKLANKNADIRNLMRQIRDLSLDKGSALTEPAPLKVTQHCPTLFNNLAELETIEPVLVVSWTEHGDLASIDIEKNGKTESARHMYLDDRDGKDKVVLVERVPIPQDDWLTGLGFYIRVEKCQDVYSRERDERREEDLDIDVESRRDHTDNRRIVGLCVYFVTQHPVHLGAHGEILSKVDVARNKFVVGLTMTRRTYRGTISHASLIQARATYCGNLERFTRRRR